MTTRIQSYIQQLQQVFNGNPWLDESFAKKLDGLTEAQAFAQAPDNNHSVAQVVSHLVEWRKEIFRRFIDNSSKRKLTQENNWKSNQELQQAGWHKLYDDFKGSHHQLIELLESKDDFFLGEQLGDTAFDKEYFITGLLHHDLYHLGQIGLILKWVNH